MVMPPDERAARRSYVVGEAAIGNDADEAAWSAAHMANDQVAIKRLNDEAAMRARFAGDWFDKEYPA